MGFEFLKKPRSVRFTTNRTSRKPHTKYEVVRSLHGLRQSDIIYRLKSILKKADKEIKQSANEPTSIAKHKLHIIYINRLLKELKSIQDAAKHKMELLLKYNISSSNSNNEKKPNATSLKNTENSENLRVNQYPLDPTVKETLNTIKQIFVNSKKHRTQFRNTHLSLKGTTLKQHKATLQERKKIREELRKPAMDKLQSVIDETMEKLVKLRDEHNAMLQNK